MSALRQIGTLRQHRVDDVAGDEQRRVRDLVGGDHRDAHRVRVLLVKGIDPEIRWHRADIRRQVVGDELGGLAAALAKCLALLTVTVGGLASVRLGALRPRGLQSLPVIVAPASRPLPPR